MTSATTAAMAPVASIPVLSAAGGRSSARASSWARTIPGSSASTRRTSTVFWAVMAVIADVPYAPNWWNVQRSAWIPAPPPESDPAMVSAIGGGGVIATIYGSAAAARPAPRSHFPFLPSSRFLKAMSTLLSTIRDLHRRKARERRALALAEGVRLVEEALAAGVAIKGAAIAPALEGTARGQALKAALTARSVPLELVTDAELVELADTEHPQGVVDV